MAKMKQAVAYKKKTVLRKKKPIARDDAAAEAAAWANVSSIALASYAFWKAFLVLLRGSDETDALTADDDKEFMYAVRAVSWVESAHGTGAGMSAARDPMQCGNPKDSWWTQITGTADNFDRFVRGGSGSKNYYANELPGVVINETNWNAGASLSNLTDPTKGHGTQGDDNGYTQTISYWWGIPHLIWAINAGAGGRPAYACGDVQRADLKAGCVAYNGKGDAEYPAKIDAAYKLFADSQLDTRATVVVAGLHRTNTQLNFLRVARAAAEEAVATARGLAPFAAVEARVRVGPATAEFRLDPE